MLSPELLEPIYQNRLRTIGRMLDVGDFRSVFILEVAGGFIVRAVHRANRDIEIMEFTDDTFPERMIQATEARGEGERPESPSPLAPTGFEDLLRAMGRWLDSNNVAEIAIAEKLDSLVVTGDDLSGEQAVPFDIELDETAITELLDESFRLRTRRD